MADLILTGASRGIGRALAVALASQREIRLVLVARDRVRLDEVASQVAERGGRARVVPGDLSSLDGARKLGRRLVDETGPYATLIHNAGIWPHERELTGDGLERAFGVNCAAPLVMQRELLDAGRLRRILVVSAGVIFTGRFDGSRTPQGEDFSSLRTYCNTKLAFAVAMRDVAAEHRGIDVAVVHPGVVRTDLGARPGAIGRLLSLVKRRWEAPELCAARLVRFLELQPWSPPGEARWFVEDRRQQWPAIAESAGTRAAVRGALRRLLGPYTAPRGQAVRSASS